MNEEMKAHDLLRSAARLIERATLQLDTRSHPCGECGSRHFENKAHARAYERVSDLPAKLRTVAELLVTGTEPDAQHIVDSTARELGLSARDRLGKALRRDDASRRQR